MAIRGPRSGTWSREQGSQDATVLGPSTGPGARCLSLSSGPTTSCLCDFKQGTPCSMPQFPHPYRGQDVFTHMTGAFGLCRSSWGPPVALRPQQGNVASGDTGSWPSARPGIVKEGTGQRQPVSHGCPQRVPSLCCASSARPGAHPRPGSHMLPERVFSPHVSVCHLPPAPCAPRRQRACQPQSLCVPSVQPRAQHAMGVQAESFVGVSQCAPYHPGGSTETAGVGRADAWRGTCSPSLGQACVGSDPAQSPGASSWSQHDSMFPYVEPVA